METPALLDSSTVVMFEHWETHLAIKAYSSTHPWSIDTYAQAQVMYGSVVCAGDSVVVAVTGLNEDRFVSHSVQNISIGKDNMTRILND